MPEIMPGNIAATAIAIGLLLAAPLTLLLALIGHIILVSPVRDVPRLCIRRRLMLWLGIAGTFAGVAISMLTPAARDTSALWPPLIGLTFGMISGNVLGRIVWLRLQQTGEEMDS